MKLFYPIFFSIILFVVLGCVSEPVEFGDEETDGFKETISKDLLDFFEKKIKDEITASDLEIAEKKDDEVTYPETADDEEYDSGIDKKDEVETVTVEVEVVECQKDEDCDDNDLCTEDKCENKSCVHTAKVCDDQNPCTKDSCDKGKGCVFEPVSDCCVASEDCNDSDVCTVDKCVDNVCVHETVDDCCHEDSDCDDSNLCTMDVCVENKCSFEKIENCCVTDEDCNDGNSCTTDKCVDNFCTHDEIPDCCNTTPCCGNGVCEDGEKCNECVKDCGFCAGTEDCCSAHASAGCKDKDVSNCVCSEKPSCCLSEWSEDCVKLVYALNCGGCEKGDCCSVHNTPGCNKPDVETCVCNAMPSCCLSEWNEDCVSLINSNFCGVCEICGDGFCVEGETCESCPQDCGFCIGKKDCCSVHDEPSCDSAEVANCVCSKKPSCCTDTWDKSCVNLVYSLNCGGCKKGDCCTPHDTPGCSDSEIESCVCTLNSKCCEEGFSEECVNLVNSASCGVCKICGDGLCVEGEDCKNCYPDCGFCAGSGACCEAHESPSCSDVDVANCVCDKYPSCCLLKWDDSCVSYVNELACGFCTKCGNGVCDEGEDCKNCPDDCGFCPGSGSCCEVHDTPGCGDFDVMSCVCENNKGCCTDKWGALCVLGVENYGCGVCKKGDCCEAHDTPGCADAEIENCVCNLKAKCCDDSWSQECVDAISAFECGSCSVCGDGVCDENESCDTCEADCGFCAGTGSCCKPHETAGCEDVTVENCVCKENPSCCTDVWSQECVELISQLQCGDCKTTDCCSAHSSPGCNDSEIKDCVCAVMPSCCTDQWSEDCVTAVNQTNCGVCPFCGDGACNGNETCESCPQDCGYCAGSEDCCITHQTKGCNDSAINQCVCEKMPSCCNDSWSFECVLAVNENGCGKCKSSEDCCTAHELPGCKQKDVEQCVCEVDPSCCEDSWSDACVLDIKLLGCGVCPFCGDGECNGEETCDNCHEDCGFCAGSEPCCTVHDTGGCVDIDVTNCVCKENPSCCTDSWSEDCVTLVDSAECGTCQKGDCCTSNLSPGCDTPDIETCVCADKPECCQNVWNEECVLLVDSLNCGVCAVCGNGKCDIAEDCNSCPDDCGYCTGTEDCCTAHDAPSCNNKEVIDCVCKDMPECCLNSWSEDCVSFMKSAGCGTCPFCGDGTCNGDEDCKTCPDDCGFCTSDKDCCLVHDEPGCNDENTNSCVCNIMSSCCTDGWTLECVQALLDNGCGDCGTCGDGKCLGVEDCSNCSDDCGFCVGTGDCCIPKATASCSDENIVNCVCKQNPLCCEVLWNQDCVNLVNELGCGSCAVCGDGVCGDGEDCSTCPADCGECAPAGSCCEPHNNPGCEDKFVMDCVCANDPFCCQGNWDFRCVNEVDEFSCGACAPDSCCKPHDTPGCLKNDVAQCVCDAHPECCTDSWSEDCVNYVDTMGCGICAHCGDGVCNGGEDCVTCYEDCGFCPGEGNCCGIHDKGGCGDIEVEQCVCEVYPSCCLTKWDKECVNHVNELNCGKCVKEDCCTPHASPGCKDETVESCVCSGMPSCCENEWTQDCVDAISVSNCGSCSVCGNGVCEIDENCSTCPEDCGFCTGTGDCCTPQTQASCNDQNIINCVCKVHPECCTDSWNENCVNYVNELNCGDCIKGSCCFAHDTPGCNDPDIESCVCAKMPSCCDISWDQGCVDTLMQESCGTCPVCGNGVCEDGEDCNNCQKDCGYCLGVGDCCTAHDTPGCNDKKIQDCVCAIDEACCTDIWSDSCVNQVIQGGCGTCPVCGNGICEEGEKCNDCSEDCGFCTGSGSCCDMHDTPGCSDQEIVNCVCANNPSCCYQAWDLICVDLVDSLGCGTCAEDTSCCSAHTTPGCDDKTVEQCVCDADSACCEQEWNETCVSEVVSLNCGTCTVCGDGKCEAGEDCSSCQKDCGFCTGEGSCCIAHDTPSCDAQEIVNCVCNSDTYCCTDKWDQTCVNEVDSFGCGTCTQ